MICNILFQKFHHGSRLLHFSYSRSEVVILIVNQRFFQRFVQDNDPKIFVNWADIIFIIIVVWYFLCQKSIIEVQLYCFSSQNHTIWQSSLLVFGLLPSNPNFLFKVFYRALNNISCMIIRAAPLIFPSVDKFTELLFCLCICKISFELCSTIV